MPPESKKSRTNEYHSMREEIQSGIGVTQETTTLSSVSVVIYFRRYFNLYGGVLYCLKIVSHITSKKYHKQNNFHGHSCNNCNEFDGVDARKVVLHYRNLSSRVFGLKLASYCDPINTLKRKHS